MASLKLVCIPLFTYFIPCCMMEFLLVFTIIKSPHCTTTILMKNAVWHVDSIIFLASKVCIGQHKNKAVFIQIFKTLIFLLLSHLCYNIEAFLFHIWIAKALTLTHC